MSAEQSEWLISASHRVLNDDYVYEFDLSGLSDDALSRIEKLVDEVNARLGCEVEV